MHQTKSICPPLVTLCCLRLEYCVYHCLPNTPRREGLVVFGEIEEISSGFNTRSYNDICASSTGVFYQATVRDLDQLRGYGNLSKDLCLI